MTIRQLERRLRDAGLRATRPRLLVLELLDGLSGHYAADELVGLLAQQGTPVPRTSVYNVVNALAERGLAMIADAGPGRTLYEVTDTWHHHLVCGSCAAVMDIPCATGRHPCLDARLPGADIERAQVIFRGRCPDCTGRSPTRRTGGEAR